MHVKLAKIKTPSYWEFNKHTVTEPQVTLRPFHCSLRPPDALRLHPCFLLTPPSDLPRLTFVTSEPCLLIPRDLLLLLSILNHYYSTDLKMIDFLLNYAFILLKVLFINLTNKY